MLTCSSNKHSLFSSIFSMKQKRKVAVNPATEDFLEEAVIMESHKPGTSHERETAWETVT